MMRLVGICCLWIAGSALGQEGTRVRELAKQLAEVDTTLLPPESEQAQRARGMMYADMKARRHQANLRESTAWRKLTIRKEWETFRDQRLAALSRSLGDPIEVPKRLRVEVTERIEGDGYRIDNLVFASRPGLVVTANLYKPSSSSEPKPGILICHSHHAPKTQGELQDMGVTWAKAGCYVLVMDQLGHGERRQHPFPNTSSFDGSFRVSRQDYYFRYNTGIQLHLVGESLLGWMVWDLQRGVDLLLSQPGIDRERIILLGAVAGGGDPASVTAALDRRITAAVPFNFGGPQPETVFPLPENAEDRFNYAGGGSWESTRNLRLSIRDGFMPWLIVGAIAPRGLIYAHEFAWDKDHDPVWDRLGKLQEFYGVERLASVKGRGNVRLRPPEATHCTNIGPVHRKQIYPTLKKWFDMPIPKEVSERRPSTELACLTPQAAKKLNANPLYVLTSKKATEQLERARSMRRGKSTQEQRSLLREQWSKVLGDIEPKGRAVVQSATREMLAGARVERILLEVEKDIVVPVVVVLPSTTKSKRLPVLIGVSQHGKDSVLDKYAEPIAECVSNGIAVCLPDVRGTGETQLGSARGRRSSSTGLSSSELMLGRTFVGLRLRDLRSVLGYLRTRDDIDAKRMALWGTSLAPANAPDQKIAVPLGIDKMPKGCEPLGGLLALLGTLYEDDVVGTYIQGGLVGYQSVLKSPFVYIPHDVVLPGVLESSDLSDVVATLAPRPVRLEGLVNARNQRVDEKTLRAVYGYAQSVYQKHEGEFEVSYTAPSGDHLATWARRVLASTSREKR